MDCHKLDEQIMDFLYDELAADEKAEVRAHLDECARCTAEIERFQATRRAVGALELLEPPAAVSAKLLHQAAAAHRRPLWRGRSRLFRYTAVAVPMLAAAAALVLVFHVKEKAMTPIAPRADTARSEPEATAAATPAEAPKAGELAGKAATGEADVEDIAGQAMPRGHAATGRDKSEAEAKEAAKPARRMAANLPTEKKKPAAAPLAKDVKFKPSSTMPPGKLGRARLAEGNKEGGGAAVGGMVEPTMAQPAQKRAQPAPAQTPPAAPPPAPAAVDQSLRLQTRGSAAPPAQAAPAPVKQKGNVGEYLEGRKESPPASTYRTPEINEMSQSMAPKTEVGSVSPDDVFRQVLTSARENNCERVIERVGLLENLKYWARNPQNMSEAYRHRADCQRNPTDKNNDLRRAQQLRYQIEKQATEQQRERERSSKPSKAAEPAKK